VPQIHQIRFDMEDSPCHQEMVELAAVGSPEERNRLRDFTNIMLEHDSGTPDSPDDVQDDETAEQEEPGDCAELNACEGELSACADLTDVLQALTQGIETRKGQEGSASTSQPVRKLRSKSRMPRALELL
jgi:hypothetical protein